MLAGSTWVHAPDVELPNATTAEQPVRQRAHSAHPSVHVGPARCAETVQVLIEHRNGSVRHLLNWRQLVDECNNFTGWQLKPGSPYKRVQCRWVLGSSGVGCGG